MDIFVRILSSRLTVVDFLTEHAAEIVATIVITLPTLVQISPIKINPWSLLARSIGRAINKDVSDTVTDIKISMDSHIKIDDERYAKQCRMRILRFNDEILQGRNHTKEHFDEILDDITEYENYCWEHPRYKNSKAVMAIQNIENTYQQCMIDKSFL